MKITEDLADWHRELIDERNHVGIHQRLTAEDVIRLIERTSQAEAERDEAREKLNRINFDRTDNTSPFTRACHLLQDGFISVGKALEWWRVYVNTGNLEPIADGEGESIWDENEKLKARVKELEAQIEWLTRPVTEKEFDEYFRPNYSTRDTATVPDVDKLLASRASAEKEQK